MRVVFKKTDGTIKNRQFRDPGKFGHTKDKTKTKKTKQMIKKKNKTTNKKEKKKKRPRPKVKHIKLKR
jgi:peptide methionine sulfoxide reductase MsrA